MTTLEMILLGTLLGSFAVNLWLAGRLHAALGDIWQEKFMVAVWKDAFEDLRANSHRRDPKTGRLMRKGA